MSRASAIHILAALAALACPAMVAAQSSGGADTTRVGDRVLLHVEPGLTDSVREQTDTFTVSPGPSLVLPGVGEVSLAGVRRADIEPYLTRALGRYIRNPVVHARVLVRVAVLGEVEKPGFYAVPADAVLSDALMAAGGLTRDARLLKARIERDGSTLWSGDALQQAIAHGMTVDQMKLRAGDRIMVPKRHDAAATMQLLGLLITIPATAFALTRIF